MPFTIGGDWIPNKSTELTESHSAKKPVKVRLVKRGNSVITVILNLAMEQAQLTNFLSSLKKKLGCGGTVKDSTLEIQGDKVEPIKKILSELQIKCQ